MVPAPRHLFTAPLGGSPQRLGTAGVNRFGWNGRIGSRNLPPGSCELFATPTADGHTGVARQVGFKRVSRAHA